MKTALAFITTVACTGTSGSVLSTVPPSSSGTLGSDVIAVAAGGFHSCAPTGHFVAVSASDGRNFPHACAVTDTGRVDCWGDDTYAESSPPAVSY